ncbi:hypothetical protein BUMB_01863 [Candidatus Paraburkholderia calva]|nr:hypothetical protein BUMB_01863 [Candidatus Paraburkholderia calva]
MKKLVAALALPLLIVACGCFHNEDAGHPKVNTASTQNNVTSIVQYLTDEAKKHNTPYTQTPIPQGAMLEFGNSNVVKVRFDNGETTYRFYPGGRHASNLWIEGAGKKCAPGSITDATTGTSIKN